MTIPLTLPSAARRAARSVSTIAALAIVAVTAAVTPVSAAPTLSPHVSAIDAAGLKRLVTSHKGQVVIVNFWATWCIPCEKELPGFGRLQKEYGHRGVTVVTVSFDDRRDVASKVSPFLATTGITQDAYIDHLGTMDPEQAYFDFLEPKLAADAAVPLPRTYVFARNGREVKAFPGVPVTYSALVQTVAPLLK